MPSSPAHLFFETQKVFPYIMAQRKIDIAFRVRVEDVALCNP